MTMAVQELEQGPAGNDPAGTASTTSNGSPGGPEGSATLTRWMWVWITIGILVVLVVIGFLLGIADALESIDANLDEAASAVVSVEGDVEPLPVHIERINEALTEIDESLLPVGGKADEIIGGLNTVLVALQEVDGSLATTSGTLEGTSGGLASTSETLEDVLALVTQIRTTLDAAQRADSTGTNLIWRQVAEANDVLGPVRSDTGDILAELREVNPHLESICQALPPPGPC